MENKVKIAFGTESTSDTVCLKDKSGNEFAVRAKIPYAEKEQMAFELAEQTTVIDEEKNVCYRAYNRYAVLMYLTVKYYTNVDLAEATYGEVYDWLVVNDANNRLLEIAGDDVDIVLMMAENLFTTMQMTFDKTHSLSQKILNAFGSVLNGEDMMETMSKIPAINNGLIELMNAYNEQQKNKERNALTEEPKIVGLRHAKSKKNGIKVGGAVLNMAKKNP